MKIKKIIKSILFILLVGVIMLSSFACKGEEKISNSTHALNNVSYKPNQRRELEINSYDKLRKSAFEIYDIISEEAEENGENFVASPLSIYMAFALLDYIGDETVKEEVSEFLGLTEEEILAAGELFEYIERSAKDENGKEFRKVSLTNSIWMDVDQGYEYSKEVLDNLANNFYCYGYETPFLNDNAKANEDIRKFIKNNTNGLIDRNFELSRETLFALINTLYFKDNWNSSGWELNSKNDLFHLDDSDIRCEYVFGNYVSGVEITDEISRTMYTVTTGGYQLRFIVPNDGHTLKEAMESSYLYDLTSRSHTESAPDDFTWHQTRTIFPVFEAKGNVDIKKVLIEKKMLNHTFNGYISDLVNTPIYVSDIIHDAILKVDKKGIEGAAVTIIANGAESANPSEISYHDFLVDKPFGFILSTREGVVLFMGQITNPLN